MIIMIIMTMTWMTTLPNLAHQTNISADWTWPAGPKAPPFGLDFGGGKLNPPIAPLCGGSRRKVVDYSSEEEVGVKRARKESSSDFIHSSEEDEPKKKVRKVATKKVKAFCRIRPAVGSEVAVEREVVRGAEEERGGEGEASEYDCCNHGEPTDYLCPACIYSR